MDVEVEMVVNFYLSHENEVTLARVLRDQRQMSTHSRGRPISGSKRDTVSETSEISSGIDASDTCHFPFVCLGNVPLAESL